MWFSFCMDSGSCYSIRLIYPVLLTTKYYFNSIVSTDNFIEFLVASLHLQGVNRIFLLSPECTRSKFNYRERKTCLNMNVSELIKYAEYSVVVYTRLANDTKW